MNRTTERFPKLLPWLARKAGIEERRAETLWREASRQAALRAGRGTSAHHAAAMERFVELLTAETQREDAACFGLRTWARAQASLWRTPAALFDAAALSMARSWRLIGHSFG